MKLFISHSIFRRFFLGLLCFGLAGAVPAAERITYYHTDALGSPVAATDAQGNVIWQESYEPYGDRIKKQPASTTNSRWYTGHPLDAESGLNYAGARYYDPVIGRFMGVDPAAFTEKNIHSFNRYNYGNNNPYKYIDPDGREPLSDSADPQAELEERIAGGGNFGPDFLDYVLVGFDFAVPAATGAKLFGKVGGAAPVAQGQRAVERAITDLVNEGRTVVGRNITIETSQGRRVTDIITRGEGGLKGHEIKSGGSPYKPSQRRKDAEIECSGGCGVGKKAKDAGLSGPVKFPTEVRRYPAN